MIRVEKYEQITLLSVVDSTTATGTATRNTAPISATPSRGAIVKSPKYYLTVTDNYRRYFDEKIFEMRYTPENITIHNNLSNYGIEHKGTKYRLDRSEEMPGRSGFRIYGVSTPPGTSL